MQSRARYTKSLKHIGRVSEAQTAAMQGEAKLRILNFKTTSSEFQKPCQTAAMQDKAELGTLVYLIQGGDGITVLDGKFLKNNKRRG